MSSYPWAGLSLSWSRMTYLRSPRANIWRRNWSKRNSRRDHMGVYPPKIDALSRYIAILMEPIRPAKNELAGIGARQAVEFAQQRAHRLPHVPDAGTSGRERPRRTGARLPRGVRDRSQPQPADDPSVRPLPQQPARLAQQRGAGGQGPARPYHRGGAPLQARARPARQRALRASPDAGHADLFPDRASLHAALLDPAGPRGARARPDRARQSRLTLPEVPGRGPAAQAARRPRRQRPAGPARPCAARDLIQHRIAARRA